MQRYRTVHLEQIEHPYVDFACISPLTKKVPIFQIVCSGMVHVLRKRSPTNKRKQGLH